LFRGIVFEQSYQQVVYALRPGVNHDPQAITVAAVQAARATASVVPVASDLTAGAAARVNLMVCGQFLESVLVDVGAIALAVDGVASGIRHEAQPVEVVEQRTFVFRPAANAVVILDAQADLPAKRPGHPPHVDRVHDMTQVQVPCRRRREP
jgi:hypothetical protein